MYSNYLMFNFQAITMEINEIRLMLKHAVSIGNHRDIHRLKKIAEFNSIEI